MISFRVHATANVRPLIGEEHQAGLGEVPYKKFIEALNLKHIRVKQVVLCRSAQTLPV